MTHRRLSHLVFTAGLAVLAGCSDGPAPTAPGSTSFLSGRWTGTLTIRPDGQPETSGATTWTFQIVPQTNQQTFRATIRSEHPWLPITAEATTAIAPGPTPPTEISTQGDFESPRGCRGTLGSLGTAQATRIEATFHGVDCDGVTFDGRVVLTRGEGQ